jgi:hypothetical protein
MFVDIVVLIVGFSLLESRRILRKEDKVDSKILWLFSTMSCRLNFIELGLQGVYPHIRSVS